MIIIIININNNGTFRMNIHLNSNVYMCNKKLKVQLKSQVEYRVNMLCLKKIDESFS